MIACLQQLPVLLQIQPHQSAQYQSQQPVHIVHVVQPVHLVLLVYLLNRFLVMLHLTTLR